MEYEIYKRSSSGNYESLNLKALLSPHTVIPTFYTTCREECKHQLHYTKISKKSLSSGRLYDTFIETM